MSLRTRSILNPKKKYLQIALNSTLEDAREIIFQLPKNDRIIVEAGTPFIKRYGSDGIKQLRNWYQQHLVGTEIFPYVVADLKTMDRGETEADLAYFSGASAAIALGMAPIETLNSFVSQCQVRGIDAMIDMMNVEFPLSVLRKLKNVPPIVIVHRGVDEERLNKEKQLPLYEIQRIKGNYNMIISVAGGDTSREVQSAVFNGADIVVIWKAVYQSSAETIGLITDFLKQIK
jgi:bifunctional enzyme Fae/Hps